MEKKYGVYICKGCGIGESIDIEKLAKAVKKGPFKEENIKAHDVLCSP
jgi:quinone-modifying oxidoreductase, subunit QmoB